METEKTNPIFFANGKSYLIKHPNGDNKPAKIHVDYILGPHVLNPNSFYPPRYYDLIVYRVWFKDKKCWKYYIEPFWLFCMYNDWETI